MEIIISCDLEDQTLTEVLEKITKIQSNNEWCEISITFKGGKVAHWSDKNEHSC